MTKEQFRESQIPDKYIAKSKQRLDLLVVSAYNLFRNVT